MLWPALQYILLLIIILEGLRVRRVGSERPRALACLLLLLHGTLAWAPFSRACLATPVTPCHERGKCVRFTHQQTVQTQNEVLLSETTKLSLPPRQRPTSLFVNPC